MDDDDFNPIANKSDSKDEHSIMKYHKRVVMKDYLKSKMESSDQA